MAVNKEANSTPSVLTFEKEEEQTRSLLNASIYAFAEVNAGGLVTEWNSRAEALFGWKREEVLGQSLASLIISEQDRAFCSMNLKEFFNSGRNADFSQRLEVTGLHREEYEIPAALHMFSIRIGEAARIGIFVHDLRPPKPREEQIEQQRRFIADQLPEAYHEVNVRGSYIFSNKRYREIHGKSRVGVSYKALYSREEAAAVRAIYERVYRTKLPAKFEHPRTVDGETHFYEESVSLLKDAQDNGIGFAVITRNCTARKRNEMEVLSAREAATAATKAKSEFLANMSHEIRTPLSGIMGSLDLASQTNVTPDQYGLLKIATTSAHDLLAVINDILDFSKIEAGRLDLESSEFSIAHVLEDAISTQAENARGKQLRLICDVAPDVPNFLIGDSTRLKQVLVNLLANAVKFTERGDVALRLERLGAQLSEQERAELKFSVSDTGVGIPAEKQKLIFEAFSQADGSAGRKYGGTGLGLAISSRIVKLMGGNLQVDSKIRQGSTFYFTASYPIGQKSAAGNPVEPQTIPALCDSKSIRSLNVLLVEDNPINQKLTMQLVQRLGHRVTLAEDGKHALVRLQEDSFDLVLMDVEMPEMNGCAATAAIREQERKTRLHLPIVAMTAHNGREDRERFLRAGMDAHLTKPIASAQLEQVIKALVNSLAASLPESDAIAGPQPIEAE